ncbi:leucine-rich repeat and immunoglobulin-like domain-containing nogo receptor-interacting protein 3 [Leucoraja erinacea]|uniref:leucine-rich repeat and immunoglobulin-like domain-containing nogo receptor-interacting protein 3 n=1 Tax=Leucoraja erinaceus TaxID=7782 RepID=UPI0024563034|nr:leucine-rich repeat and immunoglobulin-like domain-containing nogo receptor-interacting protein 3 [Leucoraja erinacea]
MRRLPMRPTGPTACWQAAPRGWRALGRGPPRHPEPWTSETQPDPRVGPRRLERGDEERGGPPGAWRSSTWAHNLLAQLEPGAFAGLDRLRALNLTGNRLRYLEPGSLRGLPSLFSLDLTLNPLVALLDRGLAGPSSLRLLALGAPTLVHVGPEAFSGLGQLAQLTVAGSAVAEQAPGLGPLGNLTVLRLQGLGRPTTLPPGWLEGLGRLRALELDGWRSLRELGPGALRGVSLVWLSVTHCNLSEVPYAGLRLQSQLRYLNLSYNPIGLLRRGQFHHLARLQELRLRGAALLEVEIWAFRGLPAFRLLDLTSNQLQSLEQRAFHSVAGLQSLGLGLNPLACDCRLLWAVRRRRRLRFLGPGPVCASPPAVRGLSWAGGDGGALPAEAFRCRVPVIRGKMPPQRLRAREIPPPSILWLNPRRLLLVPGPGPLAGPGAGRSRLLPDGTLLIAGVRPTDAGNYRCVARNAGGNDSAWAALLVRHAVGPGAEPAEA